MADSRHTYAVSSNPNGGTTMTDTIDVCQALAKRVMDGTPKGWLGLPSNARVSAHSTIDEDTTLDDGDCFGTFADVRGQVRPKGFDGAARKVRTRGGLLWWQPPADLKGDPKNLAKLESRVREYFLEYWTFMGIVVEYESPPCPHCGERKRRSGSLFGVESDTDPEHITEIVGDLLADIAA
jgi:hypothetical protein